MLGGMAAISLGVVLTGSASYLIDPEAPFGERCDRYLVRNVVTTGGILGRLGMVFLALGMFGSAALTRALESLPRAALFFGATLLLLFSVTPFAFFSFTGASC